MALERNPELPILEACPGGCGSFLAADDGEVMGQVELGHGLGLYRDLRLCSDCALRHRQRGLAPETKAARNVKATATKKA